MLSDETRTLVGGDPPVRPPESVGRLVIIATGTSGTSVLGLKPEFIGPAGAGELEQLEGSEALRGGRAVLVPDAYLYADARRSASSANLDFCRAVVGARAKGATVILIIPKIATLDNRLREDADLIVTLPLKTRLEALESD